MNRGSGRRVVFADNAERRHFLGLLSGFGERFGVEVHAYCLMSNHFHLLLRSTEGSLSDAMQHLSSNFTRRVNYLRNVDGPVFRGRFHSVRVDDPAHLRVLCRYIHRNPVGVVAPNQLARYPWSSFGALVGLGPVPSWLRVDIIRGWFGDEPDRLARFVDAQSCALSPPKWLDDVARLSVDPSDARTVDPDVVCAAPGRSADLLADLEAAACDGAIDQGGHGPGIANPGRLAVMLVARDDHGVTVADVAEFYGVSRSYVRSATTRARSRVHADGRFRALVSSIAAARAA